MSLDQDALEPVGVWCRSSAADARWREHQAACGVAVVCLHCSDPDPGQAEHERLVRRRARERGGNATQHPLLAAYGGPRLFQKPNEKNGACASYKYSPNSRLLRPPACAFDFARTREQIG